MIKLLLLAVLSLSHLKDGVCDTNTQLSDASNCFTLNFYQQLTNGQSNMVSSPFSLDVLLSMLYLGSGGTTAQQLQKALGYDQLINEDIEKTFQTKLKSLTSSDGNTLDVANSIWIQKDFTVKQTFKDMVTNYFNSTLSPADFQKESHKYTGEINNWASEKTQGLIPVLFDQDLDAGTVMVLVNAMYFKGKWQSEFQKTDTKDDKFYSTPGVPSTTKFMNQQGTFSYNMDTDLEAEILEMNYLGGSMSMIIVLPSKGSSLETLEKSLSCNNFHNGLSSRLSPTLVVVTMPKFEITSTFDLVDAINKVGVTDAFSDGADFSGISEVPIKISKAIQKAVIKVYEEGSEAAVVTGIGMAESDSVGMEPPEPVYFRADRPFIFMIRHKTSNLVLFMGRVKELP